MSRSRRQKAFSYFRWVLSLVIVGIGNQLVLGNTYPSPVALEWNANPEPDVAGYKFYRGTASRVYTEVDDVGTSPGIVLTDLEPGVIYHCAVTAYNTAGQESSFSNEITFSVGTPPIDPDNSGRLVLLEAEDGQLQSPMAGFSDAGVTWVDSSVFSQNGSTTLTFPVSQTGDYHVWCRVKATSGSMDSFFVKMDDGPEHDFHVYGVPDPPDGTRSATWTWKRIHVPGAGPRTYTLDPSNHSLRFRVREPGTLLDRVVLSSNPAFVPTDDLPRTGDALVITGSPSNESREPGGSVSFAVTAAATGPVSYQWYKNGTAIPEATGEILNLENLQSTHSGNYSVSLVSGSATATTQPATLSVGAGTPAPEFRVDKLTINPDHSVTFDVTGELNTNVLVYASSDLTHWTLIGGQVNGSGTLSAADPAAIGKPRRFYKLVSVAAASTETLSGDDRTSVPQGSPTKELYVTPGL